MEPQFALGPSGQACPPGTQLYLHRSGEHVCMTDAEIAVERRHHMTKKWSNPATYWEMLWTSMVPFSGRSPSLVSPGGILLLGLAGYGVYRWRR